METKNDKYNMDRDDMDLILINILSDEATSDQQERFEQWLTEDENHREQFATIRSYWNTSVLPESLPDSDTLCQMTMSKVNKNKRFQFRNIKRKVVILLSIAASLLIGIIGTLLTQNLLFRPTENYTYVSGNSVSKLTLPDGSLIHLNKNSSLTYNSDFGKKDRKVSLIGEGYFDVTKNPDKQFIVDLGDALISVKGTVFNAYNNPDKGLKGAALVEGSVEFTTSSQHLQLTPLRKIDYDSLTEEIMVETFDPMITTAWKDNLFRYNAISFKELINNIEELYKVSIRFPGDQFNGCYTGTLDLEMSVAQLMDMLCIQAKSNWIRKDGIYYLSK